MNGARFLSLLAGVAGAAVLLWLAAGRDDADASGYLWQMLLVGGAGASLGFGLALAVVLGSVVTTTRRASSAGAVLVVLLAVVAGVWVIAAHAPTGEVATDVRRWSGDLGVLGIMNDLEPLTAAIALGLGVLVGATPALLAGRRRARASVQEVRPVTDDVTTEMPRRRAA